MLKINVRTVPHGCQRYDTIGDWQIRDPIGSRWEITVSELNDWRMEFAVAIHELVELALCRHAGIGQREVDEFDFGSSAEEPGNDPAAPYHQQHMVALGFEHYLLALLGVDWAKYEDKCQNVVADSMSSAKTETDLASPSD